MTLLYVLGGCLLVLALDPKTHERVRAWRDRLAVDQHRRRCQAMLRKAARVSLASDLTASEVARALAWRRAHDTGETLVLSGGTWEPEQLDALRLARDQWRADNPGKTVPWGHRV